jgi:hypothetical protein
MVWNSRKDCCTLGYAAQWKIEIENDTLTAVEQPGTFCCWIVPNCCRKVHIMEKKQDGVWEGQLGCTTISITVVSDGELKHLTTDGYFTLTR